MWISVDRCRFTHPLSFTAAGFSCSRAAPKQQGGERLPGCFPYFPFQQEMSHRGSTRAVLCRALRP